MTNSFEITSLIQKYDTSRKKKQTKFSRKMCMSENKRNFSNSRVSSRKSAKKGMKSPRRECAEDGLVTKLTQRIDLLTNDLNDKNYRIRELTAEIFNWKQKFGDVKLKFEKAQEKKKLLKKYLKEKVEALVQVEEGLLCSNEMINKLSDKNETIHIDRDRLEDQYHKELESIVTTLSSIKTYDEDTIQSESLIEVINRSILELKEENISLCHVKNENSRLQSIENEYLKLKQDHYMLKSKYSSTLKSDKKKMLSKQIMSVVHSKLQSYKNEIYYLKSSFKSELSMLKSSMESAFGSLQLKYREVTMREGFRRESDMIRYKELEQVLLGVRQVGFEWVGIS